MPESDYAFEPIPGLPEHLPKGEVILWQGRPSAWRLAVEAMGLYWLLGYFGLLTSWAIATNYEAVGLIGAVASAVPFAALALLLTGLVFLVAQVQARATIYTVTTARTVLRVGAALSLTLNVPHAKLANAGLDLRSGGTGTIALEMMGTPRIGYLALWPHVRPWHMRQVQPALRCIPDAAEVAKLLADAAETRLSEITVAPLPQPDAVPAE